MNNRNTEESQRYHEVTKHSYESVRRDTHTLDWITVPLSIKFIPISDRFLCRVTLLGLKPMRCRP